MIHYSCDRCSRRIDSEEVRYSVKIQINAAIEPLENESDEERDHLSELQEILEKMDDTEFEDFSQAAFQRQQFDLCCDCHRQFVQNPLATEKNSIFDFSDN